MLRALTLVFLAAVVVAVVTTVLGVSDSELEEAEVTLLVSSLDDVVVGLLPGLESATEDVKTALPIKSFTVEAFKVCN